MLHYKYVGDVSCIQYDIRRSLKIYTHLLVSLLYLFFTVHGLGLFKTPD